jgi:hypothetical protein
MKVTSILIPYSTLVFYDAPDVVHCKDSNGNDHLVSRVVETGYSDDDNLYYYGVRISNDRLFKFLDGSLDLRECLELPFENQWNLSKINDDGNLEVIEIYDEVMDKFLPKSGFYL